MHPYVFADQCAKKKNLVGKKRKAKIESLSTRMIESVLLAITRERVFWIRLNLPDPRIPRDHNSKFNSDRKKRKSMNVRTDGRTDTTSP